MNIQFIKPEVKTGKKYRGKILRYTLDEERKVFRLYVVLDREPEIEFMKRFDVDQNVGSAFALFCNDMGIYMEDDTVELDELEGIHVIVKLKKGRNEKLYIQEILLDVKYYQAQKEHEEE